MRFLDFLFWHYYSYIDQKKTVKEEGTWPAILLMIFTTMSILGFITGNIEIFICDLPLPEGRGNLKYKVAYPIGFLYTLFLIYRYRKKKSIVKNKYEVFRERWGDPKHVRKKNMQILLWYTILSTIGILMYAAIMGTLNKHGYLDGCRLFP